MSSATDHFNTDLSTTSKKIPRYSGELARQMADRFIDLYDFHGVFDHGVVKLSFSNKFFSDRWLPYILINMISTHSWYEREGFHAVYWWQYKISTNVTLPRLPIMFFSANLRRVHSSCTAAKQSFSDVFRTRQTISVILACEAPFLHSLQTFCSNMDHHSRSQNIELFCSLRGSKMNL